MKTEIRMKENVGLMEAWSYAQYARETEREREKNYSIPKNSNSMSIHVCVFNAHFYTSPLKD